MKPLNIVQNIFLGASLGMLVVLPLWFAFGSENLVIQNLLYQISFGSVFFVMLIRPLADIFYKQRWLRRLVILRKGVGIFSASIIVGFMIGRVISPDIAYLASMFTKRYWSLEGGLLFAHLGDITGLILLLISNNMSMVLLKKNWKRIQKLAYVYFYTGAIYEMYVIDAFFPLVAMVIVTLAVGIAFFVNRTTSRLEL
jgi:DMSO/TMAO reductase YedYZ heme-binding membrane subunit